MFEIIKKKIISTKTNLVCTRVPIFFQFPLPNVLKPCKNNNFSSFVQRPICLVPALTDDFVDDECARPTYGVVRRKVGGARVRAADDARLATLTHSGDRVIVERISLRAAIQIIHAAAIIYIRVSSIIIAARVGAALACKGTG